MPPSPSMWPKAIAEAQGAKVSVSIALIIGIAYGAFTLGSQKDPQVVEAVGKVGKIEITLERVVTVLERLEEKQTAQDRDIRAIGSQTHKTNTEVQVISTKVDEIYTARRKR